MSRREALRRIGVVLGGTVAASSVAGVLGGCQADTAPDWTPQVFSSAQNERVVALAERIIPETDTPGAAGAQVNRFIDKMLAEWHPPAYRESFLAGLEEVERHAQERFGTAFVESRPEDQDRLLTSFAQAAEEERRVPFAARDSAGTVIVPESEATQRATREGSNRGREEADDNILGDSLSTPGDSVAADPGTAGDEGAASVPPFFHVMKEQTLIGYYTSEIGMTEELQWLAAPGRYDGCVPLSDVGRTWA